MNKYITFLIIVICSVQGFQVYGQENKLFFAKTDRLLEVLQNLHTPVPKEDLNLIKKAIAANNKKSVISILDKYALLQLDINPERKLTAKQGQANAVLLQNGWSSFLVKAANKAGMKSLLEIQSEEAKRVYDGGEKIYGMGGDSKGSVVTSEDIKKRWLDFQFYKDELLPDSLSGAGIEYFIIRLYSRDAGLKTAGFSIRCGNTEMKNEATVSFNCLAAHPVKLSILDDDHTSATASLTIKDANGNIYPSQAKRLAPDLFFESQIYRSDGDTIYLPSGNYSVEYTRGAEYLKGIKKFEIKSTPGQVLDLQLKRWINPNSRGYFSGDSHIHASGCSHYTSPAQGVKPDDLIYHVVGEGVNVACILIWGRGYDYQKQFFEGKDNKLSTSKNLMHYDMEISVFPSGHAGHLVLLKLKDQYYPNTKEIDNWPTYTIPILKWAKAQGAVTGYAHSGLGLEVPNDSLPNYALPKFDGIGANEYIVSVTQNLVDFISAMDTPPVWELNIWYHTLNCGFRTRMVGETDYPCLSDDKIAHGRTYVKLDKGLTYDEWTEGLKTGRSYISDGKSHIMDFTVNGIEAGTKNSEVNLTAPAAITISARVAALLSPEKDTTIKPLNYYKEIWSQKPFWDLEQGRIKNTRTVPVELIINGEVRATKTIVADGTVQDISFETEIEKSSWVAVRIMPSSHTNPVFVLVNKEPIRASKKSAAWCLKAVNICWAQKQSQIAPESKAEALKFYDAARLIYQKIQEESKQ